MVAEPSEYPWSSYAHHAGIKPDVLLTDHPLYWSLGNTPFDRELAYRELVKQGIGDREMSSLKDATWKGWALGSDHFKNALERQTQRRVSPAKRGRPRKEKTIRQK
jgi:putative transposase